MVYRIYVEKKPGLAHEAAALLKELRDNLGITRLTGLRLYNRYDVEELSPELFARCVPLVFSEPQLDTVTEDLPAGGTVFAVEYLPGQFDQRADSAAQCVQILSQGADCAIEVDGGVSPDNASALADAGADILVAGSSVFRAADPAAAIRAIRG